MTQLNSRSKTLTHAVVSAVSNWKVLENLELLGISTRYGFSEIMAFKMVKIASEIQFLQRTGS